jgi:hypothetical protein
MDRCRERVTKKAPMQAPFLFVWFDVLLFDSVQAGAAPETSGARYIFCHHHDSFPRQPGLHDVPLKFNELLIVVDTVAAEIGAVNDVKWTVAQT